MPRKIVIVPSFAESHLLKCSIPNWIEVIKPDIIIINEGLFPEGPENKGHITPEFRKKWCYNDTMSGFDFEQTMLLIQQLNKIFPRTHIWLQQNGYTLEDSNKCFIESISRCDITSFEYDDLIFPLEPDALLHEKDSEQIHKITEALLPGQGISVKWIDFLETQYYTEYVNILNPKYRRFCYRFDNMENYRKSMNAFMSQDYIRLYKEHSFDIFHYCWFRPEPWKQLRFDLIYRNDPNYWNMFNDGLHQIRRESKRYFNGAATKITEDPLRELIIIRPSRQDAGKFAHFIDISHPKHIQNHSNFIK